MYVEPSQFDGLARLAARSRRAMLRAAFGGVFAASVWSTDRLEANAKRGKSKKKKKTCKYGGCLGPPRRCCPRGTRPSSAFYPNDGSCHCCPEKRVWVSGAGARLCCPAGTRAIPNGGVTTNGGQCCQEDQFCNGTCCSPNMVCDQGKCVEKCENGRVWCRPAEGGGTCCQTTEICRTGQCLEPCDFSQTQCDTPDGRFLCCDPDWVCQNERTDHYPRCCSPERACDNGDCCFEGRVCYKDMCVICEPNQIVSECPSGLAICCAPREHCYDTFSGHVDCCHEGRVCPLESGYSECCDEDEDCLEKGCAGVCTDGEYPCEANGYRTCCWETEVCRTRLDTGSPFCDTPEG